MPMAPEKDEFRRKLGLFGSRLHDRTVADAAGAGLDGFDLAGRLLMADLLQIGHETALGLDVGMAYIVPGLGTLSAYITNLAHGDLLYIL